MLLRKFVAAVIFVFCISTSEAAKPTMIRISPDLPVYPQYFSIEQDKQRHIYIGGTDGILRFDGSRWLWLKTPKPGAVRALHTDGRGRLWVGGSNCFGYIETSTTGELKYIVLAPQFSRDISEKNFSDIWQIAEYRDHIYFRGLRDLFRVDINGQRSGYWYNEKRLGEVADIQGELWLQWRGEGIRKLSGEQFTPVSGTGMFSSKLIYNMLPMKDGSVLLTDISGLFAVWKDGKAIALKGEEITKEAVHAVNGIALNDKVFAFAGDDGILRLFDIDQRKFERIVVGNGFIPEVKLDADGAMLAVDDVGMIRLQWPFEWQQLDATDGIKGLIYSIDKVGNRIFLSTASGVYESKYSQKNVIETAFAPAGFTQDEAWQVISDDAALLLAESRLLSQINRANVTASSRDDLYPRVLLRDPVNKNLVWAGTEFGPALFEKQGATYREKGHFGKEALLIDSLAATPVGILLGSDKHGLAIARLDPKNEKGFSTTFFSNEHGIEYGEKKIAVVSAVGDTVFASTEKGLFRFTGKHFVKDDVSGLKKLLGNTETVKLKAADNGDLWAFSFHAVYHKKENEPWQMALSARPADGPFLSMLLLPGGDALIGCLGKIMHYQADMGAIRKHAATLGISSVRLVHKGKPEQLFSLSDTASFKMMGGSLEFNLAYTDYSESNGKQYQFWLEGFDKQWSEWTRQPSFRFYSLPPGKYILHTRARRGYSNATDGKPYAFEVEPRWFERPWLIPFVLLSACFLIGAGLIQRQRNRVRNLRLKNIELDKLVHERTKNLELLNLNLRDLADRDGLTGIANRRKFDQFLEQAVLQAKANKLALGMALIDVDHFKQYNDTYGHQAGDDVLKQVAQCIAESVRGDTLVARYGGEEFAIVAPACTGEVMHALAARICKHIEEIMDGVTVSIGVNALDGSTEDSAEALLARADAALYQAKSSGRNRVV